MTTTKDQASRIVADACGMRSPTTARMLAARVAALIEAGEPEDRVLARLNPPARIESVEHLRTIGEEDVLTRSRSTQAAFGKVASGQPVVQIDQAAMAKGIATALRKLAERQVQLHQQVVASLENLSQRLERAQLAPQRIPMSESARAHMAAQHPDNAKPYGGSDHAPRVQTGRLKPGPIMDRFDQVRTAEQLREDGWERHQLRQDRKLTRQQLEVLNELDRHVNDDCEGITVVELAAILGIGYATADARIRPLLANGEVERKRTGTGYVYRRVAS